MRLISRSETKEYEEVVVESKFLFWTYRSTYRKFDGSIFEFKEPDNYRKLGLSEFCDIYTYFKIKL